jgi:hypothetical protein
MLKTVTSGVTGQLNYAGTWNASTNTPTLASGVGTKNTYYVVSFAGSTNLDGITDWQVGDWAIFNGTVWQKIDQTNTVSSVNGQVGAVVLGPNDVGATANTTFILATGLLSGGGRLNANATITLTSVPVANVTGAVPDTVNVLTSGLITGGGALTGNVTISLANVPSANVTGLGTMATQNSNAVTITGGSINAEVTSLTGNTSISATMSNASLLLVPAGYLFTNVNSTVVKIPYYAV